MFRLVVMYLIVALNFTTITTIEYLDQMSSGMPQQHVFVSKVEPKKNQTNTWMCDCYNSTDGVDLETECRCYGKELKEIPPDLDENLHRITLTDSDIRFVKRNSFQPYKETLRDV